MAERKLQQLQKTIRQLELAGGGRNVEMRREFNGLLGQYLAQDGAKPLQGGGGWCSVPLIREIAKVFGMCEADPPAPEWFKTEITKKGAVEFAKTLGEGIASSGDDVRTATLQFQALKNSGLKIAADHDTKTEGILTGFMTTGEGAQDIICLQEGPTRPDEFSVPAGYTLIHPGDDPVGPPVVYFKSIKYTQQHSDALDNIQNALGSSRQGNGYVYWIGTNTQKPAKILIVPLKVGTKPLTVVSYHANSGGASKWETKDMTALTAAIEGDYIICADTNAKKSINVGKEDEDAAKFAKKLGMETVYPEKGTATCNKTRTIMQAQPSKAGDQDHSLKDIIGCSTRLSISDGTITHGDTGVDKGLPSESFPSDHAYVAATVHEGENQHKVVQWNAAWIADSWAEFVLPTMGSPPSAAQFNRFFLDQMETYFKATLGEPTYNAMDDSTDPRIPKGWLIFYALASACGKRDQKFSKRSHIVDICKARDEEKFQASLSVVPPISDISSNAPQVAGADDRMLQLYYGAHKYVCNKLTETKEDRVLGKGAQEFLDQMVNPTEPPHA